MTLVTRAKPRNLQTLLERNLINRHNSMLQRHARNGMTLCRDWLDQETFVSQAQDLPGFSRRILSTAHVLFRTDGLTPFSPDNSLFIPGWVGPASTRQYLMVRQPHSRRRDLILSKAAAHRALEIDPTTMVRYADSGESYYGYRFEWIEPTPAYVHAMVTLGRVYV